MIIEVKKIGKILVSREAGREAFLVTQSILQNIKDGEKIDIDFNGVSSISPAWGAEFLMPLLERYGEKLVLKNTHNGSVQSTLEFLEQIEKKKFEIKK